MNAQDAAVERAAEAYHDERSPANMNALVEAMEPLIVVWLKCGPVRPPAWADAECLQAGRLKLLDIAQLWSNSGEARFVGYAKPNIVGAMQRAARDARWGRGRRRRKNCSLDAIPEDVQSFDETGNTEHTMRLAAQQILDELPDTLRIIVRMYYLEGYTVEEIARVGGFTPDAVEQLLQQALVRLQAQGARQ